MKKFFSIAAIFGALCTVSAQGMPSAFTTANGEKIVGYDQVLVVVEDTTITLEDLMRAMAPLIQKLRTESRNELEYNHNFNQLSKAMLQDLVDKVIIVKEFHDKGYMIPQSVFDAQFEDDLKNNFNGDRSEFLKYLQSQNKTIKQYRKEQEENLIVSQLRYTQRKSASEVSPSHILEYYNDNKQKWYSPERVKFRQITLTDSSPDVLKEKSQKVLEELKGGADFADVAKRHSQDEYAKNGGLSDAWYTTGQFAPEIEKAIFSLEAGQTSELMVKDNYAFIWKVEDKKAEGIQPIDEVREIIENIITNDNANIEYQKWLDRIRKKAYIRYYSLTQ